MRSIFLPMSDVTRILGEIEAGNARAADELLPLVYDALRELAANRMAEEKPGNTLQATALVHDAYIRLVDVDKAQHWDSRGHFFSAAGEAMRRILVERARKQARREEIQKSMPLLSELDRPAAFSDLELIMLDEALVGLEAESPQAASLVKLRFFAGMTVQQAAEALGISVRNAERQWTYARAWLHQQLDESSS